MRVKLLHVLECQGGDSGLLVNQVEDLWRERHIQREEANFAVSEVCRTHIPQ